MQSRMSWSYIAGFVDGEGSISKSFRVGYRITIPQTHEGVLQAIQTFTGVGGICRVNKRKEHWKESWTYFVARQEDVLFFLEKVSPHLLVKAGIAEGVLPIIKKIVLENRRKKKKLQNTIKTCKLLRNKGLSFRAIGAKINIDHGYARRMILYK